MARQAIVDDGVLVRLCDAGKRYRWGAPWVLRDVNVAAAPGRVVEVQGANGAGKSTLLRMLAGATLPTRGRRVARLDLEVGYGPERLAPAPPFPATAYLAHHARVRSLPSVEGRERTAALAGRLGLNSGLLREPLGTLSKGTLQKIVVIQALLGRPALVVLDELFAGLDAEGSNVLCGLLADLAEAGGTVVFSDHRERDTRPRADVLWRVAEAGVEVVRLDRTRPHLPSLPGVIEAQELDGRLRLIVWARDSDRVLAMLVAGGWHVTSLGAGPAPDRMRIEAAPRKGRA